MTLKIVPFEKTYIKQGFNCGSLELDEYLMKYSGQDIRRNLAALFVAVGEDDNRICGYYTLSNTGIDTRIIPPALRKRLSKYGDVPAIRLGRLAVDQRAQGQGIGARLLANAVIRSVSNVSAWALMAVDAKDEKAAVFYRKFGFDSLKDDALHLFAPRKDLELLFIDDPAE
jgi:ribosomal protein S18 acetylase RimI-like enzyme